MSNPTQQQQVIVTPKSVPVKTVISLLAMIFGTILLALGAGFALGWPAAVAVVGLALLVFGFVLGLQK